MNRQQIYQHLHKTWCATNSYKASIRKPQVCQDVRTHLIRVQFCRLGASQQWEERAPRGRSARWGCRHKVPSHTGLTSISRPCQVTCKLAVPHWKQQLWQSATSRSNTKTARVRPWRRDQMVIPSVCLPLQVRRNTQLVCDPCRVGAACRGALHRASLLAVQASIDRSATVRSKPGRHQKGATLPASTKLVSAVYNQMWLPSYLIVRRVSVRANRPGIVGYIHCGHKKSRQPLVAPVIRSGSFQCRRHGWRQLSADAAYQKSHSDTMLTSRFIIHCRAAGGFIW